jgi:hypothetical protein
MKEVAMESMFQTPLEFDQDRRYGFLRKLPAPKDDAFIKRIYHRDVTRTIVNRIESPCGFKAVVKFFGIKEHENNTEEDVRGYSESRIEAIYLCLLSKVCDRHGVDWAAGIIGHGELNDHSEVAYSGMITKKQKKQLLTDIKWKGRFAFIISEATDFSLTDLLRSSPLLAMDRAQITEFTSALIFQICFLFASLHNYIPSYRHNDAHCSNILAYTVNIDQLERDVRTEGCQRKLDKIEIEYHLMGKTWRVDLRKFPYRLLLWDMSFSSIKESEAELYGFRSVRPTQTNFGKRRTLEKTGKNQVYDIHKLIDTIRYVMRTEGLQMGQDIIDLMSKISPEEYSLVDKQKDESVVGLHQKQIIAGAIKLNTPTEFLMNTDMFSSFEHDTHSSTAPFYIQGEKTTTIHRSEEKQDTTNQSYNNNNNNNNNKEGAVYKHV